MSNSARNLLLKLLSQADRGTRPALRITERYAPEYFFNSDLGSRDEIHAYLQNAQAKGAISLEWGRREAIQDLVRIRLQNAEALADFLGVLRASDLAKQIESDLMGILELAPLWLKDVLPKALEKWSRGESAFNLRAENKSSIVELFQIATAIADDKHLNQDMRSFSVKLLGDSKAVERQRARLATLLRCNPVWANVASNNQLFAMIGLHKFPAPIFIKGSLGLLYNETHLDITFLKPYLALTPEAIQAVKMISPPAYVLTIENFSSFNRHTREIEDSGIVLYSGGFASSSLLSFMQKLDISLLPDVRFYHWGDRDIGGWRIFECIERALPDRALQPHLMTEATHHIEPFTLQDQQILSGYCKHESRNAAALARTWLDGNFGYMEQELIDPKTPK